MDALKVFDSDHDGKISVKDFKHAMMTMGERMGDAEIDEITGDSDLVNNEYILIDDFAKMIMNRIWTNSHTYLGPYWMLTEVLISLDWLDIKITN